MSTSVVRWTRRHNKIRWRILADDNSLIGIPWPEFNFPATNGTASSGTRMLLLHHLILGLPAEITVVKIDEATFMGGLLVRTTSRFSRTFIVSRGAVAAAVPRSSHRRRWGRERFGHRSAPGVPVARRKN